MLAGLRRLLIISDSRSRARAWAAMAERNGLSTRIIQHTLDFAYIMRHWHPDAVMLQVPMPDQQEADVLKDLHLANGAVRLFLIAEDEQAAREVEQLEVGTATEILRSEDKIEGALKKLCDLDHAA